MAITRIKRTAGAGTKNDPIDITDGPTKKPKVAKTTKKTTRTAISKSSNTVQKRGRKQVVSFVYDEAAAAALKTLANAEREKRKEAAKKLPPEASLYLNNSMKGRVTRAMKQRMFVLSRQLAENDESTEIFEVLGSIGNNYTVTISSRIKCTCMDYSMRKTHCKHILMVLLKVYCLPFDSPLYRSLSTKKDERIHARSFCQQVDPSVLVPEEARERIMKLMYGSSEEIAALSEAQRRPLDTSDCPVCFEEFEEEKINEIDYCKTCGNNIHKECFTMWASSKGSDVTCVYCRSKWIFPDLSEGPKKRTGKDLDSEHRLEGNFANFAQELGLEVKRDTSTYRSSQRYYDDDDGYY